MWGAARRVVAAETDRDDADLVRVDVGPLFQEIDAGAARLLIVVAQDQAAETDRLAGARSIHDQDRNAALDQVRHAGDVLDLLGDVEAVEENDARPALRFRILGMNEIPRQVLAFERHLDDLDLDVGEPGELVEAIDRGAISVERLGVLGCAETLAHLIVVTGAQIEGCGRDRMARCAEALAVGAHLVGHLNEGVEPGLVILGALAREQTSDLVQLADVGAAIASAAEHVDEGRRPPVVAGKVHEVFRRLGHRLFLPFGFLCRRKSSEDSCAHSHERRPRQSHAGARPAGFAILPSGRLSAEICFISSSVREKSKTFIFSAMRLGLDERGIGTMLPC